MKRRLSRTVIAGVVLVLAASSCRGRGQASLSGRATDEWTRNYPLAADGEVQIVGASGSVEIHAGSGSSVDVRAERVVRASTDAAAREILPRIGIREDISPERVVLQTEGLKGIVIGVDVVVNYRVTLPATAKVRVRAVNGDVTVTDVGGSVVLSSTNGKVVGQNLRGGVDARSVNGGVTITLGAFGRDPVDLRATNGSVDLALPPGINASLDANYTNGTFGIEDVPYEPYGEQTRRRARGRVNDGGAPISITTVNGSISVHASAAHQ